MGDFHVDLNGKSTGTIWNRKPTPNSKNGLLLEVSNTKAGVTAQGRRLHFTKVAFSVSGNWFIGGDQLGNIYHFDLSNNRFKRILRAGLSCTSLVCCIGRQSEVLVALADYTIKCVDIRTAEVIAVLRGHEASVHSISLHSSGVFALAVSTRDSVLWDLNSFTRCRTLNGGQEVGVQDVFFIPLTNIIMSCFKDDSIHAWESTTLAYKYQIPPPFGPTPRYRAFAVPQDGRVLVGGGRSNFLHVWTIDTKQLLRIIQLPSKIRYVKQLVFLHDSFSGGTSETLGVLAQDGIVRFINIHTCKQLFHIGSHQQTLVTVQPAPHGNHIVAVSDVGNIVIYDISSLGYRQDKVLNPVVGIVDDSPPCSLSTSHHISAATSSTLHQKPTPRSKKKKVGSTPLIPPERREDMAPGGDMVDGKGLELNRDKLMSILHGYGEYPAKYRMFIWRRLLKLPENHRAYSTLLEKGTHPSYAALHEKCPMKSRKLLRVLQRALSALAFWAQIFGETEYLPGLVFPFVKMFQNNQLATFEIVATILMNWCGHWFEYFPNPPLNVLGMVENLLAHHDPNLLQHFVSLNLTSQLYAWPLLQTLFSEVLSKGEWLRLWDNVISQPPGYLLLVVVSYLTTARPTLLKCTGKEDIKFFFQHQNPVDVGTVVKEANLLQQTTPRNIHPEHLLDPFEPLSRGTYPIFNKYPKFIVDFQLQERQRIRSEELEYLRERQTALELDRMTEQRRAEEEAWYQQQKLLFDAEEQRRKMMDLEEKKLTDQRTRLQALKRELKVKELHVLDAARRRFLGHQQQVREAELHRMDQQLRKKVVNREKETQAVLQDIETRTIELERQKALLEDELRHCQEEMRQKVRQETSVGLHSVEVDTEAMERAVEEEAQRERERLDAAHRKLAKVQAETANLATIQEAKARRELREMKHDVQMEEVAERTKYNILKEHQVGALLDELQRENRSLLKVRAGYNSSTTTTTRNTTGNTTGTTGNTTGTTTLETNDTSGISGRVGYSGDNDDTTQDSTPQPHPAQAVTVADSGDSPPQDTDPSNQDSGVMWSHRRELLDQQESAMLSRIRNLRQKVAGHIKVATRSHETHNSACSSR